MTSTPVPPPASISPSVAVRAWGPIPHESTFTSWWPAPAKPQPWVIAAAIGVGVVAAVMLPGAPRPGINIVTCGLAAAVPIGLLARAEGRRRGRARPIGRISIALGTVAVGLSSVAAVRASEWLAWGCVLAALCLGAAVALDVRRWTAVFSTVPLFATAVLRSLPWAGRQVRMENARSSLPWLRGLSIGLVFTLVIAGLLASADDTFARILNAISSAFTVNLILARLIIFTMAAGTMLGAAFAVSTRFTLARTENTTAGRHPAEWVLPLGLVAVTIAGFLTLEATRLFGGAEVLHEVSTTHADRAREGFGQLTVVTLLVLGLLSWAGRHAARGSARDRRLMAGVGGLLLGLTLLLSVSALRRLSLYQDAYGWTVTRINAGAFELWVTLVLLGVAVGWALRRTDLVPRFVIGSAGLGLLVVAMIGPDALVASGNVHRFNDSGRIDTQYLSTLSADAVPALDRLPEPQRSCALLGQTPTSDPWYGWNLDRWKANRVLEARPPAVCTQPQSR